MSTADEAIRNGRPLAASSGLIGRQPPVPQDVVAKVRAHRRDEGFPVLWLITPASLWLFLFLVAPLAGIVVFSFWESTGHGMAPAFTVDHYREFFRTEGFFDPATERFLTPTIFIRTLWTTFYFTALVMIICLIVGYPIAYFLALQVQQFKWQLALFLLAMVPFWTSYLIRAVAWLPMLGRRGLLNIFLVETGIVDEPVSFLLYSEFGYVMALVQL